MTLRFRSAGLATLLLLAAWVGLSSVAAAGVICSADTGAMGAGDDSPGVPVPQQDDQPQFVAPGLPAQGGMGSGGSITFGFGSPSAVAATGGLTVSGPAATGWHVLDERTFVPPAPASDLLRPPRH